MTTLTDLPYDIIAAIETLVAAHPFRSTAVLFTCKSMSASLMRTTNYKCMWEAAAYVTLEDRILSAAIGDASVATLESMLVKDSNHTVHLSRAMHSAVRLGLVPAVKRLLDTFCACTPAYNHHLWARYVVVEAATTNMAMSQEAHILIAYALQRMCSGNVRYFEYDMLIKAMNGVLEVFDGTTAAGGVMSSQGMTVTAVHRSRAQHTALALLCRLPGQSRLHRMQFAKRRLNDSDAKLWNMTTERFLEALRAMPPGQCIPW
jgi:hypothetical protein